MFDAKTYIDRRSRLKKQIKSGVILFLGNSGSPMNYPDNQYPFRQDSSFLYFFGLDFADLAAVIDIDENKEIVFGDDLTVDQIVWTGTQPTLKEKCEKTAVAETAPLDSLAQVVKKAIQKKRQIHFLPPYRAEHLIKLEKLLGIHHTKISQYISSDLIKAVVAQREIKSPEEIKQIKFAVEVANQMQTAAMKASRPGLIEQEIVGIIEGIAVSKAAGLAFPIIFSVHGETLHNLYHKNIMKAGDMAVNDSGADSPMHYISDITRTIPVGGKFTSRQRPFYELVFNVLQKAIDALKPGIEFRDIHTLACKTLAEGLKELGLMKGDIEQAVAAGAHALFFQCGLGHMIGLDVHDMEGLGENFVGYTETIKRSSQFGLKSLRLAKKLQPGFVITVEPGIYFIPELIDLWKTQKKFTEFINYDKVETFKNFGGIRIEDNILITDTGFENLSERIPKKIDDVEKVCAP
jgi:Xaa-Pro aminopeptidase